MPTSLQKPLSDPAKALQRHRGGDFTECLVQGQGVPLLTLRLNLLRIILGLGLGCMEC